MPSDLRVRSFSSHLDEVRRRCYHESSKEADGISLNDRLLMEASKRIEEEEDDKDVEDEEGWETEKSEKEGVHHIQSATSKGKSSKGQLLIKPKTKNDKKVEETEAQTRDCDIYMSGNVYEGQDACLSYRIRYTPLLHLCCKALCEN